MLEIPGQTKFFSDLPPNTKDFIYKENQLLVLIYDVITVFKINALTNRL